MGWWEHVLHLGVSYDTLQYSMTAQWSRVHKPAPAAVNSADGVTGSSSHQCQTDLHIYKQNQRERTKCLVVSLKFINIYQPLKYIFSSLPNLCKLFQRYSITNGGVSLDSGQQLAGKGKDTRQNDAINIDDDNISAVFSPHDQSMANH